MRLNAAATTGRRRWPAMWLAGLMLTLTASACSSFSAQARLARLALPSASQLPCCWQAEEKVEISAPDTQMTLTAAVAVQGPSLTVVIFDGLGRRTATVRHEEGEPRTDAPPEWPAQLSRQMLLALYLHHLGAEQWRFDDPAWHIADDGARRSLSYRGQAAIQIEYSGTRQMEGAVHNHGLNEPRTVRFVGQSLTLQLTTVARSDL